MRRFALLFAAILLAPLPARAQGRNFSIDDLYDPEKKRDFNGKPPSDLVWVSDKQYLWPKPDSGRTDWLKVDALSGRTEPLFDAARVEAALAALEGVTPEEAKRQSQQRKFTMNAARTALLLTIGGDLYHYDLAAHRALRLTRSEGKEEEADFSPDGRRVAFVRGNNLHVVDLETQRELALTDDGSGDVLNGKLDWVYQEEIYGRGRFRAYWWSPDAKRIAFLRLDEKDVPRYTLVDDIPYRPEVEVYPYPKAGDPNPKARLGVVPASGGAAVWIDDRKYAGAETLIVDVAWTRDGKQVAYQVQDREQTWLDLNFGDPTAGNVRTLLRETTGTWVERIGSPHWLKDGGFLWLSDRSGFRHVYRYASDGRLLRPITAGKWEVRSVDGLDEAKGFLYFSGTERSPIGSDVYRIRLDGTGLQRLSRAEGTHKPNFNPGFSHYIDSWSESSVPTQVRLHRAADGAEVRLIDENRPPALAEYRFSKPEFVQVPARDGFTLEALLIKPPDFDPARKYPVLQHTYGGPHAPSVRNAWGGTNALFLQLLAQRGVVVWICDNRTASGKSAESTWPGYKQLGVTELQDVEDGVAWLKRQPWVDPERIGIEGWSYGGFMVSYALTHSKSFAMGIAGGSVTDWRDYDSIYTERYMRTPQNNPEGYKASSPRFAAKDLSGRLLLLHGAFDDNVHPQNTLQFAHELQKAGKPFRLMLYPKSRHSVTDPPLLKHLRAGMLEFIEETLLAPRP